MTIQDILAPVTGLVSKIEKAVGDEVATHHEVMIIESMKMEIGVQPEAAGRLTEILVAEGDAVDEGQVVATLEVGD